MLGGALFYSENYVKRNKNTLYFKKWNVMNGEDSVGQGQYMTNVQGAESEAAALRNGYASVLDSAMTFLIPVYENMPSKACAKPTQEETPTITKPEKPEKDPLTVNYAEEAAKELGERLGRGCRIVTGRKKGRIELEYYGTDDLNDLLDALHAIRKK